MTRLGFGLSREIWLVQIGIFLNALGWGAVLPFEVIYLHDGRGFALGTAGLVVGTLTGLAVLSAPSAGPLIDRFGSRPVAAAAGVALAAGYTGLAFAQTEPVAFAAAAIGGIGNGALLPAQSSLLAALAPSAVRHRATAVSRVCTNAGFGLGGAVGGVVAGLGLDGFVALFLLNAATYLAYVGVLLAVVRSAAPPEPLGGGYRRVLGDGPFLHLALTNIVIVAIGWGVISWIVPPYAKSELGVGPRLIGLLLLANAATVVAAQVPIARLAEGRRRTTLMSVAAGLLAAACLLILAARGLGAAGYAAVLVATIVVAVGECFHTAVLMPLVADLAPDRLRGRYMATIGLSWWIGLGIAPTAGAQLLSVSAAVTFLGSALAAAAAGGSMLALDRRLPGNARFTPRPDAPVRIDAAAGAEPASG
jgi:MFS family permease